MVGGEAAEARSWLRANNGQGLHCISTSIVAADIAKAKESCRRKIVGNDRGRKREGGSWNRGEGRRKERGEIEQ